MDNAARIYQELLHEAGGIWFIFDEYGFKINVKAPSNAIKAIIKGCKVTLIFGKDNLVNPPIFHSCIRIYDDPINFLNLSGTHRFIEDHVAVKQIMEAPTVQVQLYDELNMCVAFVDLKLIESVKQEILALLDNPTNLYCGDFTKQLSRSLDFFDFSSGVKREFIDVRLIDVVTVEIKLENFTIMKNLVIGFNHKEALDVNNSNEGKVLEQQVWAALDYLFKNDIYRNPQIKNKQGYRELTDILANSQYGIFLIETKTIAIINTEKEATMDRKVLNVQKAIKKGISQLTGAAKKMQEKVDVFDQNKNEIHFDKSLCPHCIVLVSEILPFGDWKGVEMLIFTAMIEQRMFLHIMELKELMQYIGYAKGDKNNFDHFLMQRMDSFIKEPNVHSKTTFQ